MHITCNTDAKNASVKNDFTIDNDIISCLNVLWPKYRTITYSVKHGSKGYNEISFTVAKESITPYLLIGLLGFAAIVGFSIVLWNQKGQRPVSQREMPIQIKTEVKGVQP